MEDCAKKLRQLHGEAHLRAKLTEADVLEIRAGYRHGLGYIGLAKEYGVGKTTIEAIITRRTWKHLPADSMGLTPQILRSTG